MTVTRILRRPRVLIVGCGDVGLRCVQQLRARRTGVRIFALTSQPERQAALRAAGAVPLVADLDRPRTLARLAGLARVTLHLAPPAPQHLDDRRTRALLGALTTPARSRLAIACASWRRAALPQRRTTRRIVPERFAAQPFVLVYVSTSGIYGDCDGARIDETRPVRPANARAWRRLSAEQQVRRATARGVLSARIVRVPGIYAADRLPLKRLIQCKPALVAAEDVYTNHIHADDLATILWRAVTRGKPARVVHAADDTELKMGDYFDRVADAFGLARPPRITRAQAEQQLDALSLSFMRESRRLANERVKREFRLALRYASVDEFLSELMRCLRK